MKITLSLKGQDKTHLESLALEFGYTWGDRPNISKLVEAIARRQLTIAPNNDWPKARIAVLNYARTVLAQAGEFGLAIELAQLLCERSELTIPLRTELEQFINSTHGWRLKLEKYLMSWQPFRFCYQEADGQIRQLTIRYGEIATHEGRQYLDCWCEEANDGQRLPELTHNWSLRLDQITDPSMVVIDGDWVGSLDWIPVKIRLNDRELVWPLTNLGYFLKEVLHYGRDCEVISPAEIRHLMGQEVRSTLKNYREGGLAI
jgi:hypothetical protein